MDTLRSDGREAVEKKVNDQGLHECQVFGDGPEATESCRSWESCRKNPGHAQFIPYSELCADHMPADWVTADRLESVRIVAGATVRLRVGFTSWARPEGFAFHNTRGSTTTHTGTGWVFDISTHTDTPCPCPECVVSSRPRPAWLEVTVATACHVVYDTDEARQTQVDFFYDDEKSIEEGKMKTVQGSDVLIKNAARDTCLLRCVTHDARLAEKLGQLRAAASKTLKKHRCLSNWRPALDNVCVIVSHPHGRAKHVSVGLVKGFTQEEVDSSARLVYSASTCPGSSGALVLPVDPGGPEKPANSAVHSLGGVYEGLGQSSSEFQHYRPRYDELFDAVPHSQYDTCFYPETF